VKKLGPALRTIFIPLALSLAMLSCAGEAEYRKVVHQEPGLLVVLDRREIPASPSVERAYDHPVSISPALLQRTLEAVRVQQEPGLLMRLIVGKREARSLVDPETAPLFALKLSNALAEAGPQERVDFYLVSSPAAVTQSVSSGSFFVKDRRLHLRLDHFRTPLGNGAPLTAVEQPEPGQTGKRETDFTLVEGPHLAHRKYKNWLGLSESDPHWLIADYAVLAAEPLPVDPRAAAELPAPPQPPSDVPPVGLEEKLRTLKRLREEGLISEQEYIEKKRALLKDF
jgi:hypothetical protein